MWTRFLPHTTSRRALEGAPRRHHRGRGLHGQLLYPDGPQRLADPSLAAAPARPGDPIPSRSPTSSSFRAVRRPERWSRQASTAQRDHQRHQPGRGHGTLSSTMLAKTPPRRRSPEPRATSSSTTPSTAHHHGPARRQHRTGDRRYDPPRRTTASPMRQRSSAARLLVDGKTESDLLPSTRPSGSCRSSRLRHQSVSASPAR